MSRQGHTRLYKPGNKGWALTADASASLLKADSPRHQMLGVKFTQATRSGPTGDPAHHRSFWFPKKGMLVNISEEVYISMASSFSE